MLRKVLFLYLILLSTNLVLGAQTQNAQEVYLLAEALYEKGEYDNCLMQLDKTVEILGKTNARIQCLRANSLFALKNFSNTEKELEDFYALSDKSIDQISRMNEIKMKILEIKVKKHEELERKQEESKRELIEDISGNWRIEFDGSKQAIIRKNSIVRIKQTGKDVLIIADTFIPSGEIGFGKGMKLRKDFQWKGTFENKIIKASAWGGKTNLELALSEDGKVMKGMLSSLGTRDLLMPKKYHCKVILNRE